jgi:hypothetical protein
VKGGVAHDLKGGPLWSFVEWQTRRDLQFDRREVARPNECVTSRSRREAPLVEMQLFDRASQSA